MPFTEDAQAYRDGMLIQLTYNQNITKKKDLKRVEDLIPYLGDKHSWVEHPTVLKVNNLINVCRSDDALADLMSKVLEEIEIERNKPKPDEYLITKLCEIYRNNLRVP